MADAGCAEKIGQFTAETASRTLDTLAAEVDKVPSTSQHTESFYFQELDPKISLARQLPYALRLREAASATPDPAVQLSAQRLGEALEQLAQKIKTGFLRTGNDTEEILTAYAHEDGRTTP
jgi:hypothetical protein